MSVMGIFRQRRQQRYILGYRETKIARHCGWSCPRRAHHLCSRMDRTPGIGQIMDRSSWRCAIAGWQMGCRADGAERRRDDGLQYTALSHPDRWATVAGNCLVPSGERIHRRWQSRRSSSER